MALRPSWMPQLLKKWLASLIFGHHVLSTKKTTVAVWLTQQVLSLNHWNIDESSLKPYSYVGTVEGGLKQKYLLIIYTESITECVVIQRWYTIA